MCQAIKISPIETCSLPGKLVGEQLGYGWMLQALANPGRLKCLAHTIPSKGKHTHTHAFVCINIYIYI